MKRFLVVLSFSLIWITHAEAQNAFYFKKWKAKEEIFAKKVVLLMDSTNSIEGTEYNKKLGQLISDKLNQKGVRTQFGFNLNATLRSTLAIGFEQIKPAYVKLNTFKSKIPLCNRFEIRQLNNFPKKDNQRIITELSISVDEEDKGLAQASEALADLIYKSLRK